MSYDFSELPEEIQRLYLLKLPVPDIANYCAVNPSVHKICADDYFWLLKVDHDFPGISQYKPENITYQQQFLDLLRITDPNEAAKEGRKDILVYLESQGKVPKDILYMIPKDRYINQDDIYLFDRQKIIREFEINFATSVLRSKIQLSCFNVIRPMLQDLFNLLNDGDVLLIPGDSSFKIIHTMRLNHEIEPNLFMFDGIVKKITILDFPLSATGNIPPEKLDSYLLLQLESKNVPLDSNFILYDLVGEGSSYRALRRALGRLKRVTPIPLPERAIHMMYYKDSTLSLMPMDIGWYRIRENPELINTPFDYYGSREYLEETYIEKQRVWKVQEKMITSCSGLDMDAISDAEITDSRCVISYDMKTNSSIGSLYNCNLIIAMMVLAESNPF